MSLVPVFCGKDCGGDACPLLAKVENGRVTRVYNNPLGGRYLRGCKRGFDLPLETYAPDRILTPLVRSGPRGSGQFREASWEEALDLTANRLGEIRAKHGPSAVLARGSAGATGALHATYMVLDRFMSLFGGCTRLTGSLSNGAASFVLPYLLGPDWTRSGFDASTMQSAEMIILWGANVLETRMGAEVPARLLEAKQRGAQIVAIEPRRSYTVQHTQAWWLPCRPGTDAALMLAVLYVLFSENLADRVFIAAHAQGFVELERQVLGLDGGPACTPAWASEICATPESEIIAFARAYAAARPALLFPGYSIQRVHAGEETYRLAVALQIATGNFGVRGGSTGSMNNLLPSPRVGRLHSPLISPQPSLPVLRWPDAILEGTSGGYPSDIHAVYNMGSNLINQGADIRKSVAAFEKLDFAVSHEVFMTPTARHCDVIFPAATSLEKEDIGLPWLGNYLLYKSAVLPVRGQARSDYDTAWDLAERLGFGTQFSEGLTAAGWVSRFMAESEVPDHEEFRRTGIYIAPEQDRVGLADFSADPAGHPLQTPSGKVEILSRRYAADSGQSPLPAWQPAPRDPRYPLLLISPKSRHYTHSQGSNLPAVRARADHALSIHPQDAAARGIQDGETVLLFNEQGKGLVRARFSADLVPGVVSLPEGIWVELGPDGLDRGGSANMYTSTQGTAAVTANIMHGMQVEVERG